MTEIRELREEIARIIAKDDDWEIYGTVASDILAIPRLQEALKAYGEGCQVCEDGRG